MHAYIVEQASGNAIDLSLNARYVPSTYMKEDDDIMSD